MHTFIAFTRHQHMCALLILTSIFIVTILKMEQYCPVEQHRASMRYPSVLSLDLQTQFKHKYSLRYPSVVSLDLQTWSKHKYSTRYPSTAPLDLQTQSKHEYSRRYSSVVSLDLQTWSKHNHEISQHSISGSTNLVQTQS